MKSRILSNTELRMMFAKYPGNEKKLLSFIRNNNYAFDMTSAEFFSFYDQHCNFCPRFDEHCINRLHQIYHFDKIDDKIRLIQIIEWSQNRHFIYPYLRVLSFYGLDYIKYIQPMLVNEISQKYCDMILKE